MIKFPKLDKSNQILNNSSIDIETSDKLFEIYPQEIFFQDIQTNMTYQINIYVKNLTKKPQKIRVFQPKEMKFQCDYEIQGAIAAGLTLKLVLSFSTQKINDYHDYLKIVSDNKYSFDIPLHALQAQPQILFDPMINLSYVQQSKTTEYQIKFKNEGKASGTINLKMREEYSQLTLETNEFTLEPNEENEIRLSFKSDELGIFKGFIDVQVNNFRNILKQIEVNVTSVGHLIYMVDDQGQKIDSLNFNQMYYGSEKILTAYLVNNTPQTFTFSSKIRNGVVNDQNQQYTLITPQDLGIENSQSVCHVSPIEGQIEAYSQLLIEFKFLTQVLEKHADQALVYAISQQRQSDILFETFQYTVIYNFDNQQNLLMNVQGQAMIPTFKMSQKIFNFGNCQCGDQKQIEFTIKNQNPSLSLDFNFVKTSFFRVLPKQVFLKSNEEQTLTAIFKPHNLGKFNSNLNLILLTNYNLQLLFQGYSNDLQPKFKLKKFIDRSLQLEEQPQKTRYKNHSEINIKVGLQDYVQKSNDSQYTQFMNKINHQNVYKSYIQDQTKAKRDRILKSFNDKEIDVMKNNMNKMVKIIDDKSEGRENWLDMDLMVNRLIKEPYLQFNKQKDDFKKYKTDKSFDQKENQKFKPDPNQIPKQLFHAQPKTHQEMVDCQMDLFGHHLQKIIAGPIQINFGNIFVKSRVRQTFWIRNENENSIIVQMKQEDKELEQSYQKPQVINPGKSAGFDVIIQSEKLQEFKSQVKYHINYKQEFSFQVEASIGPVKLGINRSKIKFQFTDDNLEFETTEIVKIQNNGNAKAHYIWKSMTDSKIFSIIPQSGFVESNSFQDCLVTYSPNNSSSGKIDEDKLQLKVQDGNDLVLNLQGQINEVKCNFTQDQLDLGSICIFKKVESQLFIKNQSKYSSVLHVKQVPLGMEIIPMKARLVSDETKQFKLILYFKSEQDIQSTIIIQARGQKPMSIPIKFQSRTPKVNIVEKKFDFGNLTTHGIPGKLPLTLENVSQVPATLILDLRPNEFNMGVECMGISLPDQKGNKQVKNDLILEQIEPNQDTQINVQKQPDPVQNLDSLSNMSNSMEQEDHKVTDKTQTRYFKLYLQPNQTQQYILSFVAQDITTYQFQLPISIIGAGTTSSIERFIQSVGIQPRFFLQPQFIEFKKKTIANMDQRVSSVQNFMICNPNKQPLEWFIDKSEFQEDQIFDINPNSGILNQNEEIEIQASFNPYKEGIFELGANLYLDGDKKKVHMKIKLKGEGIFPKITFDRREIILPTVPLNVVSRCFFRIYNEGYDNFNLKPNFQSESAQINLKLFYPDGKNLNISRKKIRLEITFKNDKPQSFTSKLEFTDDNSRCYSIPVSGTTDNCIMTNFSYLQRSINEYKILGEVGCPIMLSEIINDDLESMIGLNNTTSQGQKSGTSSSQQNLGYSPIPQVYVQKNIKSCLNWINHFAQSFQISNFPQDLIDHNGQQIYDLLQFFIGKLPTFKYKLQENFTNQGGIEKSLAQKLVAQYDEIILYLKENGALLNSIRPQYLLSYHDFQNFLQSNKHKDQLNQNSSKITNTRYQYIQNDCWVQLVFQIIKVFYLQRINLKIVKQNTVQKMSHEQFPENYMQQSNLYCENEVLIIWWLELHSQETGRITNLEVDLRNGHVIANVLKSYIKSQKLEQILNLKKKCITDDDYKQNQIKIFTALQEVGIQTPLTLEDLINPSLKDMFLFCMQLFFSLPYYQPVKETIMFDCILGEQTVKYIELENNLNKNITYQVKYEGSNDFVIDENSVIKIEGKSSYKFKVLFASRVSKTQTGRVWFTSKKEGNSQLANALVFDLTSKITGRKSIQIWQAQSKLYQLEECKLQITNNYMKSKEDQVEFQVELFQQKEEVKGEKVLKKQKTLSKPEELVENTKIAPFFITKTKLKIRKGDTVTFVVQFLPFEMETQRCKLVFTEPEVGEFQHEIIGEVLLPDMTQEFKIDQTIYVDQKYQQNFIFPFRNEQLFNALKIHETRLIQFNKQKEKEDLQKKKQISDSINFQVSMLPATSFIQFPEFFTTQTVMKKNNQKLNQDEVKQPTEKELAELESNNKFPIQIHFKNPVQSLNTQFIFTTQDKLDIRVFRIHISIFPIPIKTQIEMIAQIGEVCTQEIPFINYSNKDWTIKLSLTNESTKPGPICFMGPNKEKEFFVKKYSTAQYPISYAPINLNESRALLVFQNPYTNDIHEYSLKGIVKEPLAQEHIIINCEARQNTVKKISISNPTFRQISYIVETDLQIISGQQSFDLLPYSNFTYEFIVHSLIGGIYTGQITFQEKDDANKYIWYTVCINVERTKCSKQIELQCIVRQSIEFQIEIQNSSDQKSDYEITLDGEYIQGADNMQIPPKSSQNYCLLYSPTTVGEKKGTVTIYNKNFGEIWYELNLIGLKSPPQKLPLFKAELGKFTLFNIVLENPSIHKIDTIAKIVNTLNFEVLPQNIIITPKSQTTVQIKYTPTNIDTIETGEVLIQTDKIGDWKYYLQGCGQNPTAFEETKVTCPITTDLQFMVKFRNPFKDPINIQIELDDFNSDQNIFSLDLKRKKIIIEALSVQQIPITFSPRKINFYHSMLIIKALNNITWKFPIKGLTQCLGSDEIMSFKTKTRTQFSKQLHFQPKGLDSLNIKNEIFSMSIENIPENQKEQLVQSLNFNVIKNKLNDPNDSLIFEMSFFPQKPGIFPMDILITRNTGGSWIYHLLLTSTEPDPDDVIHINSEINKSSIVQFKMNNIQRQDIKFDAYLTHDSPPVFKVNPTQGILPGKGKGGLEFQVQYNPLVYGQLYIGKIIIETQNYFWSLKVIGSYPAYLSPDAVQEQANSVLNYSIPNKQFIQRRQSVMSLQDFSEF